MCSISVLILTLNEERNLPDCLETLKWCDDVVVFDSGSSDRTKDIAESAGVRYCCRKFDGYAAQRNAALSEVEYKHPWVLMVDADERCTPELVAEMQLAVAETDDDVTLFRFRRKDYFMGRWLKRSSGYPTWFGRLMKLGKVRFEREINEDAVTDGRTDMLKGHLIHYPFSKGISFWFERHNRYSSMEAVALTEEVGQKLVFRDLFSRAPAKRRKALKQLAYRMPFRPVLVFFFLYIVRLGILDGRAGLTFCSFRAAYEYMIDLKILELKERAKEARARRRQARAS